MEKIPIPEEEVLVVERVKCARCGSDIMLKNLRQHEKTAKCINMGVAVRKPPKAKPKAEVSRDCLGAVKFNQVQEEDEPMDIIMDDLEDLTANLGVLMNLCKEGFSALLGDDIQIPETIPEEEDYSSEEDEPPVPVPAKAPVKRCKIKLPETGKIVKVSAVI